MKEIFTSLLSDMEDTLFLDGMCGLCQKSGKFVVKRLVKPLTISELNSEAGMKVIADYSITADSLILVRSGKPFIKSAAAIRTLLYLRWNWRWLFPFAWLVPLPLRDIIYLIVSKSRHLLKSE